MKFLRPALLVVAFVFFMYSIAFTSTPSSRYAEYHCQHNAIFNTTGKSDYVTVGGSRSLQGVGAPEFAERVKAVTGKDVIATDLSRSWRGQGVNYILIRDMLENHEVGTLVIEANLAQTSKYHERFHLMARFPDFMTSYGGQTVNGSNYEIGFELLVKAKDRVMNRISKRLNGSLKPAPTLLDKTPIETTDCMSREELVNVSALTRAKGRHKQYYEGKVWNWDWDKATELHNTRFYEKLVSLATDYDTPIVFYYVHEAYYKKLDPTFAAKFEARYGAPLLIPPSDLVDQLEPLYADQTHMTKEGRRLYTNWLADRVMATVPAS